MGFACLLTLGAHAQTSYLNETFDAETIGNAPNDAAVRRTGLVTVEAGTGLIGTDNVAHFNDTSTSAGGILEYNVGESALGSLYVSFDIFNNASGNTGSATNPLTFSIGNWSTSTSVLLNATATRSFALEISQTGATNTLRIRTASGGILFQTTYDMAAVNNFKVFINDHSTTTVDYLIPDTTSVATLSADSAVIYINDSLVSGSVSSGFALNTTSASGYVLGDATLGRIGFNTTSSTTGDFLIDNIYASSIPSAVPEPSASAALAGLGLLGFAFWCRRRS